MAERERVAEAIRVAAERAAAGEHVDEVLRFLRTSGFSMAHCVIALARSGLCEQGEAKNIVLSSPVWADVAQEHAQVVRELTNEPLQDD